MDRDQERESNLQDIVHDAQEAHREGAEVLRSDRDGQEYSDQFGWGTKAEHAEREAYRERIDRQSRDENFALLNKQKYADAAEAAKIVRARAVDQNQMADMSEAARKQGTSLPQAVRNYYELEKTFAKSPVDGLLALSSRLNLHPGQIAQMMAPYAQQHHPEVGRADAHAAGKYNEAMSLAAQAEQILGGEWRQLEKTVAAVLQDQRFQRSGDMRQDLHNAVLTARELHRHHREGQQSAKSRRASRGVGGGGGNDGDYEPRSPRQRDRLSSIRDDIEKASREVG